MSGVAGMGRPNEIQNPVANIADAVTPQIAPTQTPSPVSSSPMAGVPDSSVPAQQDLSDLDALMQQHQDSQSGSSQDLSDLDAMMAEHQKSSGSFMDNAAAHVREVMGGKAFDENAHRMYSDTPTETNLSGITNLKHSFATTDVERKQVLEDHFGQDNVKQSGKEFSVKIDGSWKKVNPGFDWGGLTAGTIASATTGGMLAAGGVETATGIGAPIGIPTMIGANAAGAVVGKEAKDYIAENLGIKRDPNRSAIGEDTMTAALGGTTGMFVGWLRNFVAAKGTQLAAQNALAADSSVATENELKGAQELVDHAKQAGIVSNVGGTDVVLTPEQIAQGTSAQNSTKLITQSRVAKASEQVQEFLRAQGTMLKNSWNRILKPVGDFANLDEATLQQAGDKVADSLDAAKQVEGKTIERFRQQAIDAAGEGKVPVTKAKTAFDGIIQQLGLTADGSMVAEKSADGTFIPVTSRTIKDALGIDSTTVASRFARTLGKLNEALDGESRMSMQDIHDIYTDLRGQIDDYPQLAGGRTGKQILIQLKNAMRDQFTESAGQVLSDTPANQAYQNAMKKYGPLVSSLDKLGSALDEDSVNTRAFASQLFSPNSTKSLSRLGIVKDILDNYSDTNPDAWKNLVAAHIKNLMDTHTVDGTVQYGKVIDKLARLPNDALDKMFDGKVDIGNLKLFGKLASKVESSTQNAAELENQYLNLARAAWHGRLFELAKAVAKTSKGSAWVDWLNGPGQEKILADIPLKARPQAEAFFNKLTDVTSSKAAQTAGSFVGAKF